MGDKRKPRSEEDALREYEQRMREGGPVEKPRPQREEVGPLGAPAEPVSTRSKNYGSLREFQKTKTTQGGRKRANRKTRRRARRGGRRT